MNETRLDAERRPAATPAQLAIHNNFRISITTLRKSLVRAAFYLLVIQEREIHKALGFERIVDYTAHTAGFGEAQTRDLLRMGRRLRAYPDMARAVANGSVTWSKARMIAAHVSPETEKELCELARSHSEQMLREVLERRGGARRPALSVRPAVQVAAGEKADALQTVSRAAAPSPNVLASPPGESKAPRSALGRRLVVSLSFAPEDYARWEALVARLRATGRREDLSHLHLEALSALHRPRLDSTEEGRCGEPELRIVVLHCPECDRSTLVTSRGEIEAPKPLLASADCDSIHEREGARRVFRRSVVPPRLRRIVLKRDRFRCQAEGCNHVHHLEIHHRVPRAWGGRTESGNLVTLCSRCHRALHEQEAQMETLRPPDEVS